MTDSVKKPDPEPLRPGTTFAERYQVLRCLGVGGMGAVYEVLQLQTQRRRALKTLLPSLLADADARARFKLEATIAAEIDSEHIVEVLDAGVDEATGLPFLVMELLRGDNLAEVLRRRGALDVREALQVLEQVSGALDRTHHAGVVHRDLKPENLFLPERSEGSLRVKLLDFGVAKVVAQSTLASTTRSLGTPLYMSPEQIRGDGNIGPASDIYSLSQIAFTILVGIPYFEPETHASGGVYSLLVKVMEGLPEPATVRARRAGRSLSPAFDAWFSKGTALDPSERFETASELVQALASIVVPLDPVRAPTPVVTPEPAQPASPTLESVAFAERTLPSSPGDASGHAAQRSRRSRWGLLLLGAAIALAIGATLRVRTNGGMPESSGGHSAAPSPSTVETPPVRETIPRRTAPAVELIPSTSPSSTSAAMAPPKVEGVRPRSAPREKPRAPVTKPALTDPTDVR